jgi:hypothetical protein
MKQGDQGGSKKPYQKPALKVHGTLATLTASVGHSGMNDGGSGAKFATH